MIKTFYFDLDEVLVDFASSFCKAYNLPMETAKDAWSIHTSNGISLDEFYEMLSSLEHSFWANLEIISDGVMLLNWIDGHVKTWNKDRDESEHKKIYILTSPSSNPGSYSGKKECVHANFKKHSNNLIIMRDKYLVANKNSLLIDDRQKNIDLFRKHGGKAITFPNFIGVKQGEIFHLIKQEIMTML